MYQLLQTCGQARLGTLTTTRGVVETPVFMPVGTQGSVKAVSPMELEEMGYGIILGNTYHLMVRPGVEVVQELGGLHQFAGWRGSMLTDSGGYQVFSLGKLRKLSDEGAQFQSHVDGAPLFLGPAEALDIQAGLGSDIAMLFDECPAWDAGRSQVENAVRRTLLWAKKSREHLATHKRLGQFHFAIVQGAGYGDLRKSCAEELAALDFDGYAIGGVSVGEPEPEMLEAIEKAAPHLPVHKARYAMGLGMPHQMVEMVARGVDMFDCVLPTRLARNGTAFVEDGMLNLENACYIRDRGPIEEGCACYACRNFSRGYIRHLIKAKEILGMRLVSLHNLEFYARLMRRVRQTIAAGTFEAFRTEFCGRFKHRGPALKGDNYDN